MHIAGEGNGEKLVTGVRKAFDAVKQVRADNSMIEAGFGGSQLPEKNSITAKPLEEIFGATGQSKEGMFKVVIGRRVTMSCGCEMGKEMGSNPFWLGLQDRWANAFRWYSSVTVHAWLALGLVVITATRLLWHKLGGVNTLRAGQGWTYGLITFMGLWVPTAAEYVSGLNSHQ